MYNFSIFVNGNQYVVHDGDHMCVPRGRAGLLGRSGLHGRRVPAGGADPAILLQAETGQGGSRSGVDKASLKFPVRQSKPLNTQVL